MPDLWHYCCDHSAAAIARDGFLKPGVDGLVWMTDMNPPDRDALGLTMHTIKCDRMVHQFQVADTTGVITWLQARRYFRLLGHGPWVDGLELTPGARPERWYVSEVVVPVIVP